MSKIHLKPTIEKGWNRYPKPQFPKFKSLSQGQFLESSNSPLY